METALTSGILTSLAGRYAKALFDLAREKKEVESIGSYLKVLQKLLHDSKDLKQALMNPTLKRQEQANALQEICVKIAAPETLQTFTCQLIKAQRISYLPKIIEIYDNLVLQMNGELRVEVISAHPLTPSQGQVLKMVLKKSFPGTLNLIFMKDPRVLGGIMVRMGSRVIDATLVTQLDKLATAMKGSA
ncbi:MAG: ATP synthase F1 subunit delta [Alphaproteobacteria bacterium]|nr:ATP synthase F1 subunit delta [Alphaproteobacteria bacterium]